MCVFYLNIVSAVYTPIWSCSVDLLYLLYSSANIGVSYLYCLIFAVWTLCTILPKFPDLFVLPVCLCSVCEYSTYTSVRLYELFLLCYYDSVCQVTGDLRKLHNEKLNSFLRFSEYCQHKMGRKRPVWVSKHRLCDNSKMDLGRTTYNVLMPLNCGVFLD